ncbi:hypothetical protein TanjilG_32762 [Lupinus angustifolius]|uniref:Uncharacterized protein n=1 Tax=Lupinus angustifolius TaxID=3871 RepID=A0A4P1RFE2_LUPAN|nr:PREDICTED: endochitinase A-like [Lupinus angustifolius]OIW10022.1 hypothetical protein TanjilG_32762 [Lupinus angustifolius]
MKGTSKVIMGATLVMVVILAIVLGLILVLLTELYCSLLLRRRRHFRNTIPTTTTTQTTTATENASPSPSHTSQSHSHPQQQPPPPTPPFSNIYSQGVAQARRSFFLPSLTSKEDIATQKKLHAELHHVGVLAASSEPRSFLSKPSPKPTKENPLQGSSSGNLSVNHAKPCNGGEHLVYISNPIYGSDRSNVSGEDTLFETPNTSPSHLETSGSSEEDDMAMTSPCGTHSPPHAPVLTQMKKLTPEACSDSLKDARSLGTSASGSHTNNGVTSSSSGSPCTSPSW